MQITLGDDAFLHAEWASGAEMMENAERTRKCYAGHQLVGGLDRSSRRVVQIGADVRGPAKEETSKPADILNRTGYKMRPCAQPRGPGARLRAVASTTRSCKRGHQNTTTLPRRTWSPIGPSRTSGDVRLSPAPGSPVGAVLIVTGRRLRSARCITLGRALPLAWVRPRPTKNI